MDVVYWWWEVALTGCVFLGMLICAAGYRYRHLQNKLLYHPGYPGGGCERPATYGISNYEDVQICTSDGVTLRGFIVHPPAMAGPVGASSHVPFGLVYFHGNAGNVGHRIPIAILLSTQLRCSVLMMDYRGYGLSDEVPPNEQGLQIDAAACFEYMWSRSGIARERIFVMGTSLGGAVAVHLASSPLNKRRIAGLIIENSFTSISDMADVIARPLIAQHLPICHVCGFFAFKYVLKPLALFIGWRSIDRIRSISQPVLFLSGLSDELVPPQHIKRLHQAASQSRLRRLVEFPSGCHNEMYALDGYTAAIEKFVTEVLSTRDAGAVV